MSFSFELFCVCPSLPRSTLLLYGLASSAFARRYLRNLVWFLFLRLLRCFTSAGSLHYTILFMQWSVILHYSGFPIRKSADLCLFTAPRNLSQLVTSFVGSRCQGILLMLFFAWTSFTVIPFLRNNSALFLSQIIFFGCLFSAYFRLCVQKCSFLYQLFTERPVLSWKKEPKNFSRIWFGLYSSPLRISSVFFYHLLSKITGSFLNYLFRFRSLFGFQWTYSRWLCHRGGDDGNRTHYLLNAIQALSQVSYAPIEISSQGWSLEIEQR